MYILDEYRIRPLYMSNISFLIKIYSKYIEKPGVYI